MVALSYTSTPATDARSEIAERLMSTMIEMTGWPVRPPAPGEPLRNDRVLQAREFARKSGGRPTAEEVTRFQLPRRQPTKLTAERKHEIAECWVAAQRAGRGTTEAVRRRFGLDNDNTARSWVRSAKLAGLLPYTRNTSRPRIEDEV